MLREWWRFIRTLLWAVFALAAFLVFIEFFRIFVFFYRLNPIFAFAYVGALGVLVILCLVYIVRSLRSIPRILEVPDDADDLSHAGDRACRAYAAYLAAYILRLRNNPRVSAELKKHTSALRHQFEDISRKRLPAAELRPWFERMETEVVQPMLANLREKGEKEIRASVRDVMLGVMLSPYHSLDIIIVLYRNITMILRVTRIYASRPYPREQWKILMDVMRVLATVNFLNMGRKLFDGLFANLPFVGRAADDIGQGLGAGLFTSSAGHAAMLRCEAYRGWEKQEAAMTLASRTGRFFSDVKDMFIKDVVPEVKGRLFASVPDEKTEDPGFWDRLTEGITQSVDRVADTFDTFIIQPVGAGSRGLVRASSGILRGGRGRRRSRTGLFGTLGQRIKYTILGSKVNR